MHVILKIFLGISGMDDQSKMIGMKIRNYLVIKAGEAILVISTLLLIHYL